MMHRSEKILRGIDNQYYRATYKSMGFTTEDLKRPIIGIANAGRWPSGSRTVFTGPAARRWSSA